MLRFVTLCYPCVTLWCYPVLLFVIVCYPLFPCVTLCDPVVLPCVTLCYPLFPCVPLCYSELPCFTLCYPVVLPCVPLCYPVLPCVPLCSPVNLVAMVLIVCQLSRDVIGYEDFRYEWRVSIRIF